MRFHKIISTDFIRISFPSTYMYTFTKHTYYTIANNFPNIVLTSSDFWLTIITPFPVFVTLLFPFFCRVSFCVDTFYSLILLHFDDRKPLIVFLNSSISGGRGGRRPDKGLDYSQPHHNHRHSFSELVPTPLSSASTRTSACTTNQALFFPPPSPKDHHHLQVPKKSCQS